MWPNKYILKKLKRRILADSSVRNDRDENNPQELLAIDRYIDWSRNWQLTPVFLPGKFHGQRKLAGYSPWSLADSNMTEAT